MLRMNKMASNLDKMQKLKLLNRTHHKTQSVDKRYVFKLTWAILNSQPFDRLELEKFTSFKSWPWNEKGREGELIYLIVGPWKVIKRRSHTKWFIERRKKDMKFHTNIIIRLFFFRSNSSTVKRQFPKAIIISYALFNHHQFMNQCQKVMSNSFTFKIFVYK